MAAFNIVIEGAFFVTTNTPPSTEHIRNPRSDTMFTVLDDVFRFYIKNPNETHLRTGGILGGMETEYDFADLNTVTEDGVVIPIADVAALSIYLSGLLSLVVSAPIVLTDPTPPIRKQLAQLQPASTNTAELLFSPDANQEVSITAISVVNTTMQDVELIFYMDDDGTDWDATTVIANPTISKADFNPSIVNGFGVFMNNSAGSLAVEADDTSVTITVWGIIRTTT